MSVAKASLLFILPLLIVWIVANVLMTERVESELAARAGAAVGSILDQGSVSVAGRDATLGGVAFSATGSENALNAVRDTQGVRLVESAITLIPVAKPYQFKARRDGDKLVLSGNVPTCRPREACPGCQASVRGVTVVDDMAYARGAPDGFETLAAYGLSEAGKLADAAISPSTTPIPSRVAPPRRRSIGPRWRRPGNCRREPPPRRSRSPPTKSRLTS